MLRTSHYLLLLASLLLTACGHDLREIPGFDAATWRQDSYGCRGRRATLLPILTQQRELLYGTRAGAIDALLGHPDENELGEQTEKIYTYYLEPGAQCETRHPRSVARKLRLHFSPTGTVSEVLVDNAR